jgi:hypothetical protein
MTLDYAGRARACDGYRTSLNLQAVSAFRYLKEHCTFAETHSAGCVADTDAGFRSETRDRLVRECQFAASGYASVDSITIAKTFTDCDSAWRCLG